MRQLICKNCDKKYEKGVKRKNVKFCSSKCGRKYHNRGYYQEHKVELKAKKDLDPRYTDAIIESW